MRRTDIGNADHFIDLFGDEIVYCPGMKAWYLWDGRAWKMDNHNGILSMAAEMVKGMHSKAAAMDADDKNRKPALSWANNSADIRRLKSFIELAQSHKSICCSVDAFDRYPMLLNTANGAIDMETREFRGFDRSEFSTKLADVTYVKGARSEVWEQFISDIFPDQATRTFIQAAVGYSMTAGTEQDVLFILHGDGRNGKTTFVTTLLNIMGDYGAQASSNLLLHKSNNSAPSNEMVVLMGKRFVVASETGESCTLDENLIKQATGGNRVSVNPKYRSQIEFTPVWKVWLDTNHEPVIKGNDEAIWSRPIKVSFKVTIPLHKRNPKLRKFLTTDYNNRSGILNWMLDGVRLYKDLGLSLPDEITESMKAYRASQDTIGGFLSEMCHMCHGVTVNKDELYREYSTYCKSNNEYPKTKNAFGRALNSRGISDARTAGSRYWIGIEISRAVDLFPV